MTKPKLDPATLRAVEKRLGRVVYDSSLLIESALLRKDYEAAHRYQINGAAFAAMDHDVRQLLKTMLQEARAPKRPTKARKAKR